MSAVRLVRAAIAAITLCTSLTVAAAAPAQADDGHYFAWGGASDFDQTSFSWGRVISVDYLQLSGSGYAHSHDGPVTITVSLLPGNVPVYSGVLGPDETRVMNIDVWANDVPANGISVSSSPPQSQTFHGFSGTGVYVTDAHRVPSPAGPACSDRIDNDLDGRTDYPDDANCSWYDDEDESDPTPACNDGRDNDADRSADYPDDPGCSSSDDPDEFNAPNVAVLTPAAACDDRRDNDLDGWTDYPYDPGCSSYDDDDESNPAEAACGDGLDNDRDGRTDYPDDPGCSSYDDTDELNVPTLPPACGDGRDNDLDGQTDYPDDPGCSWYDDNDEFNAAPPGTCPTVLRVPVCTTVTTDNVFQSVPVSNVVLGTAATHHVNGWIDIYKFQLPTGGTANVPCVIVKVNTTTTNPCALAGGAFFSRFATLVDQTVQQPSAGLSGTLATVRVCHARVTVTAASIGVENFPAYTVC